MHELLAEIARRPRQAYAALIVLTILFAIWKSLCACGVVSLCAPQSRSKLWFSIVPLIIGLLGVWARLPVHINTSDLNINLNLGWVFLVPCCLGVTGLFQYWKSRG